MGKERGVLHFHAPAPPEGLRADVVDLAVAPAHAEPDRRRKTPRSWLHDDQQLRNTTIAELAAALEDDVVDLLLISPERLANPEFAEKIMTLVGRRPGLIVIDEVHCISDWGHDFRPDYRRIGRMIERLSAADVPVLGCTATANDRVVDDVSVQLGQNLTVLRGPLRRDGLALSTIRLDRQAERLAWLGRELDRIDGSASSPA